MPSLSAAWIKQAKEAVEKLETEEDNGGTGTQEKPAPWLSKSRKLTPEDLEEIRREKSKWHPPWIDTSGPLSSGFASPTKSGILTGALPYGIALATIGSFIAHKLKQNRLAGALAGGGIGSVMGFLGARNEVEANNKLLDTVYPHSDVGGKGVKYREFLRDIYGNENYRPGSLPMMFPTGLVI